MEQTNQNIQPKQDPVLLDPVLQDPVLPIRTCKSDVIHFFELSDEEQKEVISDYGYEDYNPDEDYFVKFQYSDGESVIPLSCFMRSNGGRYHGTYCTSNSSGFAIILSKSVEQALISLF